MYLIKLFYSDSIFYREKNQTNNYKIRCALNVHLRRKGFIDMKAEYINLFLNAAVQVFQEITQINLEMGGTSLRKGSHYDRNVIILIGITGQIKGSISVSMDSDYAMTIASKMMGGMPVTEFDDIPQSAVREIVNMIMGRVATLFEKEGTIIDITPPTLMTGEKISVSTQVSPTIVISLKDAALGQNVIDLDISIMD